MTLDLAVIRALCEAATPGPWRHETSWNNAGMPLADFYIPASCTGACVEMLAGDAALLAASRTLVPQMLAEIERLRAEFARVRPVYEAAKVWLAAPTGRDFGETLRLRNAIDTASSQDHPNG